MATLYLFRHGQASFGADDYDKLSPLGSRQAEVLGHYLRDQGIQLDAAYSGALLRQRETTALALASQPVAVQHHIDPRFDEVRNDEQIRYLVPVVAKANPAIQALVDKGLSSSKDYQKVIEAVFTHWTSGDCDEPRIQSWAEYSGAVGAALKAVMAAQGAGKTVGIFTSGGTIATIVSQVLGLSGEHAYKFYEPIFNCSVTQLFYSGDKVSLSYFNDRSFLQVLGAQQGEQLVTYR
ncbi:MAG: histidine phosphatase family protein [Haliea sp.]|uniref:histidine phosphatase family protein n=1 Tax=Haliea sp. TaxID=1932666 RepID=UPI000C5B0591|nr:histidine phosphatase family protein [Haliea sp.]MBM69822.1 histidine phosphatase family protein [Haliea sp.]|tara:strand:+ start:32626 stop:33333 length:708 start_codon:yes stop_codon:yes gene_type:complete